MQQLRNIRLNPVNWGWNLPPSIQQATTVYLGGFSINRKRQVGCDPADHKKWGGACAATCIEVVPNVVRVIQGGLHSLCTPLLLFNLTRWQPGFCNEERQMSFTIQGGPRPPCTPPSCVCTVPVIPFRI